MNTLARRAVLAGGAALALLPAARAPAQATSPFLDARTFGATFDGRTSDTAALQRAFDAAGVAGRTLFLPAGRALLTDHDGDGVCLKLTRSIRLIGEGALASCLVPARGLPPTTTVIAIAPDPAFAADFMTFERFAIADPNDGRRGGGDAIRATTRAAGGTLPRLVLRELFIGLGGGAAFRHVNDPAANQNGGLYGALIEHNAMRGAIRFEGSGDSHRIVGNIVSGPGVGIFARLTPGAAMLSILDNNITSEDGGIDVAGDGVAIARNIVEHSAPGPAGGALISVGASGRRSAGCSVMGNTVSAFGRSRATALVRAIDCDGIEIAGNLLLSGWAGRVGVEIAGASADSRIGVNSRNVNVLPPRDGGQRTQASAERDGAITR